MPGTRKIVQLYRNRELIESSNNNSALENAKLTVENLTPADGEVILVRYKEDDSDIVKSLVAVYHAEMDNEDSGWTFLTLDDYYNKEEIDETEYVIAAALAQLDGDITTLSEVVENNAQIVENNELVTAQALSDLSDRINNIDVQYLNEIKYSELVTLRNSNGLTPGMLYRITDYVTMTSQEDTHSAGHKFDIIVLALSDNKLSENAYAIQHKSDTYFDNSNLNAWEIKYSLDNDATRFEWAVESQMAELRLYKCDGYNKNGDGNMFYGDGSSALDRSDWFSYIGTMDYNGETYYAWKKYEDGGNEAGVIILTEELYMPDSLNTGNTYSENFNGTAAEIAYTMVSDGEVNYTAEGFNDSKYSDSYVCLSEFDTQISGDDSVLFEMGEGSGKGVIYYMKDEFNNECPYDFKNIQFKRKITDGELDTQSGVDNWLYTFTWIDENDNVQDASIVCQNMLNDENYAPGVHSNSMLSAVPLTPSSKSKFRLNNNVFISSYSYDNDFFYGTYMNHFGNNCVDNTFGNMCIENVFGDKCSENVLGNNVFRNVFETSVTINVFGDEIFSNRFGINFNRNTLGSDISYNTFGQNFGNNICGSHIESNVFMGNNHLNTITNNFTSNKFGFFVSNISFNKDFNRYIVIESGNSYIILTSTQTPTQSTPLRNITIAQGVNNTTPYKTISHNTLNDTFRTVYQPTDSRVVSV